ncbi:MAG: cell surface protein SprA [Chlorobi bacterium]|nr:cell surface protein SprA [Chlorobiota bacterium]
MSVFGFIAKETIAELLYSNPVVDIAGISSNSGALSAISSNKIQKNEKELQALIDNLDYYLSKSPPDSNNISNIPDSLRIPDSLQTADSLTMADTVKVDSMALDSTARLEYFKHQFKDEPYVPFHEKKKSAFFVYPSAKYLKRTVEIDSTGKYVIIKEEVAGNIMKPILKLPIDEYIKLKLKWGNRDLWEDKGYAYELKTGKYELSDLLSDITNIDIPLPSTSFLSIFGPPKISLKINGAVDIHGAWKSETTEGLTASQLGNTKNEPDFKQEVQINVSGTIGDKLEIRADWNTERTFEYENQLHLKYTGYDDEIIQSIEAGNVSLQTTPLIGGSEALFGVKANFKMGPFNLIALASQKKSEVEEVNVTGGSEKSTFEVRAYQYSQTHYFIDTVYADTSSDYNLFYLYYGNPVYRPNQNANRLKVKDIEVWKTYTGIYNPKERKGNAFIDLPPRNYTDDPNQFYESYRSQDFESENGKTIIGRRFLRLTQGVDYEIHSETGYISFKSQVQDQDAIAVAYRIEGPQQGNNEDDQFYGEFNIDAAGDTSKVIVLKLIKPPNLQPKYRTAWKLQLKNIYPIGGRDIKSEGFTYDIKYQIEGQDPVLELGGKKLIQAFELDQTDAAGTGPPDGNFDFVPGRTIIPSTGEIIFPRLQPFGGNYPANLDPNYKYQSVYDTTVTFAKQDRDKDKWIMEGEYSADVSSTFNIGFNAVENSVKVTLGGRELKEGVDYQVDYNIGQITIMNDAALVPGADLKITFEKNDLFALASKTLFGFRGTYDFNKNNYIGFSYLNLNQQTLSDKVRIGEEPLNNSIMGVDLNTKFDMPFLTKALDKVFSTSQMSTFSLKGEFAYMNPTPNTKNSTIVSDNSESIAYIDDFEGAKKIIPIGINYGTWRDLSIPDNLPYIGQLADTLQMAYKAKSFWFNILPSNVLVQDIYGDRKSAARDEQQITVLDYVMRPTERGSYNYNPAADFENEPKKNWSGMMKLLSSSANNLVEQNIEFIEFWMKLDGDISPDEYFYIDLGQISEDVIPNGVLDTEDKNQNDLIDEGEDTGIDGILDAEERAVNGVDFDDPSVDNFALGSGESIESYTQINGTQGNAVLSDLGRAPDSEDLNRNFTLDRVDSYFRYKIPLDTSRANNKFVQGGGGTNWYLIKIPLKDYEEAINNPSFSVVEFVRLWVAGVDHEVHMRLAEFNLVGNQWQKVLSPPRITEEDTVLTISTISIEDNPEYSSPPGVFQEKDKTKPDQNVLKNEQSLQLFISELEDGDSRSTVKYLYQPLDLFNYKKMKLFVHGDMDSTKGSVSYYQDLNNYGADVIFRFGTDSLNFYEYRQPLRAGWGNIDIDFAKMTAIKALRDNDSIPIKTLFKVPVEGKPGHYYGVRGKPTLTKVTALQFVVYNPPEKDGSSIAGETVSGQVWLNELRVLGADDRKGWAYSASSSIKFADILSVNFNTSQTDPFFHKLGDRFGSRVDKRSWGISTTVDIIKLLPFNLQGSNLSLNYSRSESISKPIYLPGTDILVAEAADQKKKDLENRGENAETADKIKNQMINDTYTLSVNETWSLSNIKFKVPTEAWYVRDIVNNLTFGFNYNKTYNRNPTILSSENWQWNASANYSVNFGKNLFFKPADIPIIGFLFSLISDYKDLKIRFAPSNFKALATAKRLRNFSQSRGINIDPSIHRDFTTTRGFGFLWRITEGGFLNLSLNYKVDVSASLASILAVDNVDRSESEIWRDVFHGKGFGEDYKYAQLFDFQTKPMLPTFGNLNKYFTITAGYSVSYAWQRDFRQEDLGKSAGFQSNLNAGMQIRLKSIFDPLFKSKGSSSANSRRSTANNGRSNRGRGGRSGRDRSRNVDKELEKGKEVNVEKAKTDSLGNPIKADNSPSIFLVGLNYLAQTIKYIFFDYDQIRLNFQQNSSKRGSGLLATGTGFTNFWGVGFNNMNGPSRAFQLGLSQDLGPRAPNGNLSDNFSQKTSFDIKTSRPLWQGAQIDVNWKVSWGINKTTQLQTDSLGIATVTNITSTSTIDRSFLALPFFGSGISKVAELYDPNAVDRNANLTNSFREGMETLPWFQKIPLLSEALQYIPRINWSFTWNGLEKYSIFKGIAKKISINHTYSSSYYEGSKINADGISETTSQKVSYGFNPLVGLNLTFDTFWDGNLRATLKYNTKTSFDLAVTNQNISETFSRDINISASFSKSGFELPLFGLSLKNDLEFSFSYTLGKNSVVVYEMNNYKEGGKPQDGTTRISLEPRLKYVMSSKVTISIFYKRSSVEPEGASRIPATTTNEAGLDVRITIQ